ncbi:glycosyltransferase [Niveibacterium umoris]|uniref:Glycosyltransferase n=1 Tax=Niveibacterium umoris TaxID=1193620 RepID=A0A840BK69_9RHOO|nr:glycosyltransferase family 1 protein [Niveibacterium umoris]MBB4012814.1 hypothetical protein [Niveibacterium umoris]
MSASKLVFLVHAPQRGATIENEMGRADYSYYFVMRHFVPLLERLGQVEQIDDPATQADPRHDQITANGGQAVLLLFMPPHRVPTGIRCPTLPVFAWEYSTIPNESWGADPRQNWAEVLRSLRGSITHSQFALAAVRAALGQEHASCSLPAPVWDAFLGRGAPGSLPRLDEWYLDVDGVVLDSRSLALERQGDAASPSFTKSPCRVSLSGVVYTSVFNPNDQRKNWHDLLTAFVWAFRDEPQATLLLKLVHHDAAFACGMVLHEMRKLAPYQCRVVALHGFLDDGNYARMVRGTHFVVNSSRGEGQCLPLMEFMSAGKPAVAPAHTAMTEYVSPRNSFVVRATPEWSHWPHDPRMVMRCHRYRIDWESLRDAYLASWHLAQQQPRHYAAMSRNASKALARYCASEVVVANLHDYLRGIGFAPAALPVVTRIRHRIARMRNLAMRALRGLRST